jgi:hypothetical protein
MGATLWRLNYRYLDKHRTLAFGAWPEVSLADARSRRDDARRLQPRESSVIFNAPSLSTISLSRFTEA